MRRMLLVVTGVALALSACQQAVSTPALPKEKLDWCWAHGWTLLGDSQMSSHIGNMNDLPADWATDGSGEKYNAVCDRVYNQNH